MEATQTITLYHGSDHIVRSPKLGLGKPYNDYGQGFYCTREFDMACEWACKHGGSGFANAISCTGMTCSSSTVGQTCCNSGKVQKCVKTGGSSGTGE